MLIASSILLSAALLCRPISCLPHVVPRQSSGNYTRLITFGDSYTDDGNGAWIVSNKTWPSDPAYYGHHFSNGPVWAQDLAETMGLDLMDFAVGGATADNNIVQGYTGYNSSIPVPSTADQIHTFLANNTISSSTDILTVYIGFNDVFFDPSLTAATIIAVIEGQVHTLYDAGARTIMLASYPNPATMPGESSANASAKASLTTYNTELTTGLLRVATAWSPYMKIALADVGALFTKIQADPAAYGVNASYIDPPTACLTGTYPDSGPYGLCSDPDEHLFFDVWHPTGRIHKMMAGVFQETLEGLGAS